MYQPSIGLLDTFYTTLRAGCARLSDGGGPFGFDITTALQVDYLIDAYGCDGIIKTGCFLGDTTDYLARLYPTLPIITCDVVEEHAAFAHTRLRDRPNTTVVTGDSAAVLASLTGRFDRPLVYLDAHWYDRWPLADELAAVQAGIVAVDNVDLSHPRFGYDSYDGQPLNVARLGGLVDLETLYLGDPSIAYPYPCLEVGRRSGTAYLPLGLGAHPLAAGGMFQPVPLRPAPTLPTWPDGPHAPARVSQVAS
ncbi:MULTISPECIES: O-methyltransferase [unclassified Frankia]